MTQIRTWLDFALQQMAAESYIHRFLSGELGLEAVLKVGSNNLPGDQSNVDVLPGKTRMTTLQAQEFTQKYQIVDHHANDATGFSATLMLDTQTNSYTLSFRSTESAAAAEGGDRERDLLGADAEIGFSGFAFGQLAAMEDYYQSLKANGTLPTGAVLNVTGFSLGGHLATVFTELHADEVNHTYIFNGAGRGHVPGAVPGLAAEENRISDMLTYFRSVLDNPDHALASFPRTSVYDQAKALYDAQGSSWRPFDQGTANLYGDVRYQWAKAATQSLFGPTGLTFLQAPGEVLDQGAFTKITHLYGQATTDDVQFIANSGVHAPAIPVFIEGQPLIAGLPFPSFTESGNTHSITLIIDSLAVQELIQTIDPRYGQASAELLIKASSNAKADTVASLNIANVSEGDSLEKTVEAFRKLFVGPNTASQPLPVDSTVGGFGNLVFRNEMYTAMAAITQAVQAKQAQGVVFTIDDLTDPTVSPPVIAGIADTDTDQGLAYRYALKELNPFAIMANTPQANDALYQAHNDQGQLIRVNPTDGTGALTVQYLTDRALFLKEKIALNQLDLEKSSDNVHFKDITPHGLEITTVVDLREDREFLFGSDHPDILTGGNQADHLYGGGSVDVLIGNAGRDYLEGNGGSDRLEGGAGADTMVGGAGNDTYLVDDLGDQVIEVGDNGSDTVESSVTFSLVGTTVEDLTLTGSADINGSGNDIDNLITGNSGMNRLEGKEGADHLIGNGGNDVLIGGTGDQDLLEGGIGFDTYIYNAGDGLDRIEDADAQGQIIFNGHRLLGGIHNPDDPLNTYKSLDGLTTYVLSGTDLIVNGVLIVNENFESGQFGIDLRDVPVPNWENDYPVVIDAESDGLVNNILNYSDVDDLGFGERGNDQLFGNGGNDILRGWSGNDRLYGGIGDDVLDGDWRLILFDPSNPPFELGTDLYYGDDWVEGGEGNDTIYGSWGDDVLYGGTGNDLLYGDHALSDRSTFTADDFLDGGEGDDEVHGMAGDDVLAGGDGNDTLLGGEDDDWMDGGAGADVLWAGVGHDSLSGGSGNDRLLGDLGDDLLDGGSEADVLYGGDGADELFGGAGNDFLFGDGLNTPESIGGTGGNDFLDGGDGDDEVQGMIGDDYLFGGAGNDLLLGQEGDDTLFGDDGNDQVGGGEGDDLLYGDAGEDLLDGYVGIDRLFGGDGNDGMAGGEGNDSLYGDAGNDTLQGDQGNDVLVGGAGNDIYNFSLGDGQDTITDAAVGTEGNLINFFGGIPPESLTFVHDPLQQLLTIQVNGGSDSIRLLGFDPNTFQYVIETLRFADGSFVSLADQLPPPGGLVEGTDEANLIRTSSGDDTVFAGAGDDVVQAGDGNDTLVGGGGSDTLQGGVGQDRYVFNAGDGADTIVDIAGEGNQLVFGAGLGSSVLTLRRGLGNTLEIHGLLSGDRIQIGALVPGASPISTFEFADGTVMTFEQFIARGIDLHGTQDADVMTGTSFLDRIAGDAGNDSLQGEAGDDVLDGGDGDDQLSGGEGADQLFGGEGDDFVVTDAEDTVRDGGAGIDTISFQGVFGVTFDLGISNFENVIGTEGNDTFTAASAVGPVQLFGNGGSDVLTGGAGDDVLVGGEVFVGEGAADMLIGGAGNDRLEGGTGDDAYVFNLGDGQDRIIDSAVREDPFGGGEEGDGETILESNRLIFGTGIDSQALRLSIGPGAIPLIDGIPTGSLHLSVGASDSLIFSDFDAADLFSRYTIESFEFADSLSLSYAQLVEERGFDVLGTNEDESLTGTAVADRISGFDGQDVLRSGFGADTLDGGGGDDQLFGGAGNDSYVFGVGAGQDVVFDQTGFDTIRIGAGIAPTDVRAAREANDLVLAVPSTGDSLRLQNFYLHAVFQVEQVIFADGTVWDHARLLASTRRQVNGTDGDDLLTGGVTDDTIMGLAGADSLSGQAGDDVLDGGTGADVMTGGYGEDTYLVDDIGDLVTEVIGEGTDTVLSGITYSLTSNVENLILSGTATIGGTGNELDNVLTGNTGANVLTGGAGDDTYVIGAGDLVVEAVGEGIDTVVTDQSYLLGANVENLTLTGTAAHNGTGSGLDNVLAGNSGLNVLTGGAGNDTYVIGAGDVVVEAAGEGTDTVVTDQDYVLGDAIENLSLTGNHSVNGVGNELDNRLAGNTATNVLQGGLGDDTYVVGSDDLVVEVADAGTDTVEAAESYVLGAHIENLTLLDTFPTLRVGLTPGTNESVSVGMESHYSGIGNELNNVLTGNRGDNVLEGLSGDDVLNGKSGHDTLKGGEGADTYLFGVGDGHDRIEDQSVSGEIDSIQLAPGLAPNHIGAVQSGSDLVLRMPGSEDSLTLANFFGLPSAAQKNVRFEDGTVWDEAALRQLGADPGQGVTIVDTDSGDNMLLGSSGHDVLRGGSGNDTLIGDGGNDILRDSAGNNVYDGGSGDDTLIGSAGNDSFRFGRRYGRDVVLVDQLFNDAFTIDTDHVQLVGLSRSDVLIQRQSSASGQLSFTITVLDTADQLTVRFRNGIYGFAPAPVTLYFADGTSQELGLFTDFPAAPSLTVFSSVDYALKGDEEHLVLADNNSSVVPNSRIGIGNGLDNVMLGNTADNVLEGGAGHDVLHGGFARSVEGFFFVDSGSDILIGGEGNDTLIPFGDSAFAFDFGVGTDPNPFNIPDDVLIGGSGNDTYYIRHASQTLVELPGEGIDTVHSTVSYSLPDNFENLVLTPTFHDETGFASLTGTGNDLDNVLVGGAGADLLSGGAGRDTLHGGLNATFDAGDPAAFSSSDTLIGGTGDDTYLFNLGDGTDTIEDLAGIGEGNRIQFGTGITRNDLIFSQDDVARTLTIGVGASGTDQLVLTSFDPTNANGSLVVETLVFADGSTASLASLLDGPVNQAPTVVTPLTDQTVLEDASLSIQIPTSTFVDQDAHDVLAYSASLADGTALPTWLTFDSVTHTFGGIPTNSEVGTLHLAVTATDSSGLSATSSFTLTVQNVNDAPTIAMPLADQSVTQGSLFNFIVPADSFADVDAGDTFAYSATRADGTTLPTWLMFNPSTRTFSGTPQGPDIGTLDVRVTATDSGMLSVSDVFVLTILPILGTEGNDTLVGAGGDDIIQGLAGDDVLQGLAGNDLLDGGVGVDSMAGGLGNDAFVVDVAGDVVTEGLNQGTDTVYSGITYTLGANVENLVLTDTGVLNGTGNSLNNSLTGNNANNILNGGAGADTMIGGQGNDIYVVDNVGDVVTELENEGIDTVQTGRTHTLGANLENLTLTGSAIIDGAGNLLDNTLRGNSAANVLTGGAGNDMYVVGTGDTVVEQLNEGVDTVQTAVTWTLAANVEQLTLTGAAAINGTGNSLNNVLIGNSATNTLDADGGDDTLNGGAGADILIGGIGNDTYIVDNVGDVVIENINEGTDLVQSSLSHILSANVENLTLTGTGAINATGNSLNNVLTGNSGANILDGATGADTLIGGTGNDTYVVDDAGDVVTEIANQGTDTVQSAITYVLGTEVENLTLIGSTAIHGTGTSLNNVLMGSSAVNTLTGLDGNDRLDGGAGADTLVGGLGNDIYVVDHEGDIVTENLNEGTDLVQSTVSYTLAANIENLTLTGTTAINGVGNALNNRLTGNSAQNVLTGGAGNDTYVVSTEDIVIEFANEGTDTVQGDVSWTLGANLENLTLTGTTAIDATGNMLNNRLTGNNVDNRLAGGTGNDTMRGGLGNDTYRIDRGEGRDVIVENDDTIGNSDRLQYGGTLNPLDLVISRQVNDLRLAVHGSTDQVTIKDWYLSTNHHIETVQAGNGTLLLSTQVDQLIQAMASFSQQSGLTWDQAIDQRPQDVQAILAASWQ